MYFEGRRCNHRNFYKLTQFFVPPYKMIGITVARIASVASVTNKNQKMGF